MHAQISNEQLDTLAEMHDPAQVRRRLRDIFVPPTELVLDQLEVIADFYFYTYVLGRERHFSHRKLATLLSIAQVVFETDIRSNDPKETMHLSFARLEALLLKHAVERPPSSVGVLDSDDVAAIVDFMLDTYYRHWRLYKTCFTARLEAKFTQISPFALDELPQPPPLASGTPLDIDGEPVPAPDESPEAGVN